MSCSLTKMYYPVPRRLISPYYEVPDSEIHVISFLNKRPGSGVLGKFSKIAIPGPHLVLPGSVVTGEYEPNQFTSYLFRHEGPRSVPPEQRTHEEGDDDVEKLELDDVTLFARGSIQAQIKGNTLEEQAKNVYRVHYYAQSQDEREATEVILNLHIREVLQRYAYQEYKTQKEAGVDVSKIQISKIKPAELLQALGLKQVGVRVELDEANTEFIKIGRAIIDKLDYIGVELLQISATVDLPEKANAEKNEILISKLRQKAALEDEIGKTEVITQANRNRALESQGLLEALEALTANDLISPEEAKRILFEWPAVERLIGDKTKIIFQGGGTKEKLKEILLGALEANKD